MRKITALMCVLALSIAQQVSARPHSAAVSDSTDNCYDSTDSTQIRLWNGDAPGAIGTDVCQDVPYLQVFPAANGDPSAPAMLVIPGGGYDNLTNTKEQTPVGNYFSQKLNITTFVLYYRLVQTDGSGSYRYPVPMWDGQRAIKLLRSRARDLHIDPNRIGVFGFSAGGHLASTLALHPDFNFGLPASDSIDVSSAKVNTLGLGYPVISMDTSQSFGVTNSGKNLLTGYTGAELNNLQHFLSGQYNVGQNTPPVFLFVSMDDQRIDPQNSVVFRDALNAAAVSNDTHLFAHGAHGVGLATNQPEEKVWPEQFHQWLVRQHFLNK